MSKAEEIVKRMERFEERDANWHSSWQQYADYGMPNAAQITRKTAQGSIKDDLFDSTTEDSNIQLAAGLYSYMFPTDSKAFVLETDDLALAEDDEAKQWYEKATNVIHKHLITSNFRQNFFAFLKSLGCFGPACLYEERGKTKPIRFICFHIAGIYIDYNSDGDVDTVYRPYTETARQAGQRFAKQRDKLGKEVLEALNDPEKQDKKFEFIHATEPREKFTKGSSDPLNMPFATYWVNRKEKVTILESGEPDFPYQVSHFDKDPLENYGRSPTGKKLPDIKQLNTMKKTRTKGWEKKVDPPIILPNDGSIWPLATQPAGIIYKTPGADDPTWFEFKGDMHQMDEAIKTMIQDIKSGFYLDMFDPLVDRQNMTATEVMARIEQKMRFLTPIIGRLQSDLFNPMIHRVMRILGEQKLLPAQPTQIIGKEYKVMYLGRLALAMRTLETEGLMKTLDEWAPMAENGVAGWLDNLNMDEAFRGSMRNNGAPASYLKDIKVRDQERQARLEQLQRQQLVEQIPDLAKAAKDLSKPVEDNSILKETANAA